MQYKTVAGLLLLSLLTTTEALRILVCFPMASKSHSILGHGVVNRLLEAGHEVVHITSYPRDKPTAGLKEVNVFSIGYDMRKEFNNSDSFKLKNLVGQSNIGDTFFFSFFTYTVHKKFLEHPSVIELFSDPNEKFDAVILEWFFTEMNAGIPALFECPLIWMCSTESHWQPLRLMDGIPNPAYTVDLFSSSIPPLSFWERTMGLWKILKKSILIESISTPFEMWMYNSYYPKIAAKRGVTMPSFSEAVYNGSLMLVNSHPSVAGAVKLPQNVKNVAGYHINTEVKPLPQDLQKLMDETKDGVIYFSMGSNVLSDGMSEEMKRSFLKMFSKYKQRVIWKFESNMTSIPDNVRLLQWAPQPSILAHPNLKLFITHGGQLSTTEALHYGVPLVGIPVMADQHVNMKSVEHKGFGIHVTLSEDMFPELDAAIRKVIEDSKYQNRAKELSAIYHDRPMKPGVKLAYWVEHVVRTRGAPHLRSAALDVPLYQWLFLDLAALIAVVVALLRSAVKYILQKQGKPQPKKKTS